MNKNFITSIFTVAGIIALAGCTFESKNNVIQSPEITTIENFESSEIIPTIEKNNLIVNNNQDLDSLASLAHQQVNQYRQSKNLPPLTLNESISEQARIHSQNMAQGKSPFSHEGFEQRIKLIGSTIAYRSAAENVAYNQGYRDPATSAVEGWLKSPGHYKNIIGDYNLTGMGVAQNSRGEYYFTQIFVLENN
ncbi:Cysteine-rich secretory protein family [Xenococcus sp. PCC 7305]|uniref:CAP domain-containing protein n=1 Tax=Xenococcus sp. PCC 7305 TaxID=102125 RepID=UPI0002AD06AC|nr:CAP domain-containing protein [Xenococcus sp. PCC 7305]ELS00835.1 Cysteine-rich secretory protein family [Xenococcus sp. PCC 7305]